MIIRVIFFGIIGLLGSVSFVIAVIFLLQGHDKEWVTLILAPISGICFAAVMHFADIELTFNRASFLLKDGRLSFKITRA
jgi:hypothetical protein